MSDEVTLIGKRNETSDVVSFVFKSAKPLTWHAGQFLVLVVPHDHPDQYGTERYFTISAAPFEKHLQITTRLTGSSFKNALNALPIGSELDVKEIDGDFTLDEPVGEYVFIAGGIGITPFRSILKELSHSGKPFGVRLIYGNRTEEVVFRKEMEEIAANNPNFKINYLIAPEKIDETTIRANVPDLTKPSFFVSGPEPMVEAMEKLFLNHLGVPPVRLKADFFPGYDEHNF